MRGHDDVVTPNEGLVPWDALSRMEGRKLRAAGISLRVRQIGAASLE